MTDLVTRVRRWRRDTCAHCGHRFRWKHDARFASGNRDGKVYHSPCIGYLTWRRKARQRLDVLDVVTEVWGVTSSDVRELMSNRSDGGPDAWNLAWRVFYDLDNLRTERKDAGRAS